MRCSIGASGKSPLHLLKIKTFSCWAWWCRLVIPLKQEDQKFQASLDYRRIQGYTGQLMRPCFIKIASTKFVNKNQRLFFILSGCYKTLVHKCVNTWTTYIISKSQPY